MMFSQKPKSHRIFKLLAKALNRLCICPGWSEPLLVAHTTLFEISFHCFHMCVWSEIVPVASAASKVVVLMLSVAPN